MNRRDIIKTAGLAAVGSTLQTFNSILKANTIDHKLSKGISPFVQQFSDVEAPLKTK